MRGSDAMQESLFTVAKLDDFVPSGHPLCNVRFLAHEVIEAFFAEVMALSDRQGLLSREHFSADGTLIQAWTRYKSFRPKDGGSNDQPPSGGGRNAQADLKGKPRSNDTHASTIAPDSRLYRKSRNTASILCYQRHILMENRFGLVVGTVVSHADGMGERTSALAMLDTVPDSGPKTVGADKAYDTADFIAACRQHNVTPHVAHNHEQRGSSAIDGRTARHAGYAISLAIRKRIEEHFGWNKTVGNIRQTLYRGINRIDQYFKLTMTASNLVRMARIIFAVPQGMTQ